MSRSCVTVRSCPHRLAGNADGDDVAGSEAVRPRIGLVVVAGEQDAGAVAELGAEQRRCDPEELLILVIPDLRDGLDADCVHVLLLHRLLLRRLLRNDVGRPGAMAGLHGVPGASEPAAYGPDASARCRGEQVVAVRRCELSSDDWVQLHVVLLVAATRAGRSPTRWNAWLCGGCCTAVAPTDPPDD